MLAGQAAKIEIGKHIAQQHQSAEAMRLQHVQGILGAAQLRAQMDVRQDQRIVEYLVHAS